MNCLKIVRISEYLEGKISQYAVKFILPNKRSFEEVYEIIFFGPIVGEDYYLALKIKSKYQIIKVKLKLEGL